MAAATDDPRFELVDNYDDPKDLSVTGACDSAGGMEWARVKLEWFTAGQPAALEDFIRRRANIGPEAS